MDSKRAKQENPDKAILTEIKMDYNYHTHTPRCHHATGTPEEYIKCAIDGGIKYMGFSDHAPFVFPDGYESPFRVPSNEVGDYFSELYALREKYKGQIDLKIGFEMEYYKSHFDKMLKNVIDSGAEYLIMGLHFLKEEHPDGVQPIFKTDSDELLREYAATVAEAAGCGCFTYIAHPDMLNYVGDERLYTNEMRKICVASREENIPIEINFLGIRSHRNYPNETFWKIAGEERSPVTFGCDAHGAERVCDKESLAVAEKIVKKYNLNYIGKPTLKLLSK